MPHPIDDGDAMHAFKKIMHALMGTDQSLNNMEDKLKEELAVARGQTREALESLRRMAQEMKWRVENLESQAKAREEKNGR